MGHRIEERFVVRAPVERVWSYLVDPRKVVGCLPGAELIRVVEERVFHGRVTVKAGPIVVPYQGRVHLDERDEGARVVRMTGEGKETAGAGSARMTMESRLAALPDGTTEVRVQADVDVAGRLVQLGRGMIPEISRQLFQQFSDCVRRTLEAAPGAAPPPAGGPVRAVPLVLKALWAAVAGFLRRLFGGKGG